MAKKKIQNPYGTLEEAVKYQPKGELCKQCRHVYDNCNGLDFPNMPEIKRHASEPIVIVQCTNFFDNNIHIQAQP